MATDQGEHTSRFRAGDKVRISVRYPIGHYRTPIYVRGKSGVVERVLAEFLNPEEEGFGRNEGAKVRLYRVSLDQRELWPDYGGGPRDKLQLEIYEPWLEPTGEANHERG
jgi:nitrile hydratase